MGFCGDIILPKLCNLAMHNKRLKTELNITPAQETAWTKYSNVLRDAANTMKSTREAAKTAADEFLTALDEGQKAKAREILPSLASFPKLELSKIN